MPNHLFSVKCASFLVLFLLPCLLNSCIANNTFESRLDAVVSPFRFSLFNWEVRALSGEINKASNDNDSLKADGPRIVVEYFDIMARINTEQQAIEAITTSVMSDDLTAHFSALLSLEERRDGIVKQAESALEYQLRSTLNYLDIFNQLDSLFNLKSTFPPIMLRLQEPPKLLVVSSRGIIERLTTITLNNDMSIDDISKLENAVSELDVSSLVVDLGGIATYPSFVANRYGLQFALSTAVEEWFHQYLFFRPLGFRYGLEEMGFNEPEYIVIMNETLAGIVSGEVSDIIYNKYYATYYPPASSSTVTTTTPAFDFTGFMHNTRFTVDALLAQGQINQAEAYMEQQRLVLASHGYLIRKLNQAFFAFYGSYAYQPGFENPIADNFKALRSKSGTLAAFVEQASKFVNPDELSTAVN